ncbi:MAG: adenosylcobinamide-phosphate synthase CbiB [Pseudomonadota bacterium]
MSEAIAIMLLAWAIEAVFGWPDWLYRSIKHPVVWIGSAITALEMRLNTPSASHQARYGLGAITTLFIVAIAVLPAWGLSALSGNGTASLIVQSLCASSLLASRSLDSHVRAVVQPLLAGNIEGARNATSMIVGRDTTQLDESGLAKAALESLAENTSDGVTAPLFWGCLLGLPGLAGYKAINTLDSMIGHKSERFLAFGGFAARLDDVVNLLPARLTGFVFALAAWRKQAVRAMLSDASKHASPNAGWPEAAMAGALGVRLGGPRHYSGAAKSGDHPWLNAEGRDPKAADIEAGLALYARALLIVAAVMMTVLIAVQL